MNFLIYAASIIFVLGVLVFIHEAGHYLVAKWCGVRIEVFSLGFGKRLFGFRRGDTDYRVSLIPLGGAVSNRYCRTDDEYSLHHCGAYRHFQVSQ